MFSKIIHEHSKGNEGAVDGVIIYPSEHEFTKQHRFVSRLMSVLWTPFKKFGDGNGGIDDDDNECTDADVVMMFLMAMFSPDAGKPMGNQCKGRHEKDQHSRSIFRISIWIEIS